MQNCSCPKLPHRALSIPTIAIILFVCSVGSGTAASWGGPGCVAEPELQAIVNRYLTSANPTTPELGPALPGCSVAFIHPVCGSFTYAAGFKNIATNEFLQPNDQHEVASMTKLVLSAITLMLADQGEFGPLGVDTAVDQLLSQQEIDLLVFDAYPGSPACGEAWLVKRPSFNYVLQSYVCPDFSQITIRNLLNSNHGMYDYVGDEITSEGAFASDRVVLNELLAALGFNEVLAAPDFANLAEFYGVLSDGFKSDEMFQIGGEFEPAVGRVRSRDLEFSLGNTGFGIMAVILEKVTGQKVNQLISELITSPLGLDPMFLITQSSKNLGSIARGYQMAVPGTVWPAVYASVPFGGYMATDVYEELSDGKIEYTAGQGDGGLVTSMKSYAGFLDAFLNGGLLSATAKAILQESFLEFHDQLTKNTQQFYSFGVIKTVERTNNDGSRSTTLSHDGSNFGTQCVNGVETRDTDPVPLTFSICANASGFAAGFGDGSVAAGPDIFSVAEELVDAIRTGGD